MVKTIRATVAAVLAFSVILILPGAALAKKVQSVRVNGGTNIEGVGFVIDASYDPRFDHLCPGYKMVTVAFINQGMNVVMLDPEKDIWEVRLADDGKSYKAIHNLRSQDPKAWQALPRKVQDITAYPLAVPIGGELTIDLFVPETVDLSRFNELDMTLRSLGGRIEVMVTQ